ncbi:MAG: hypothetical protein ACE5IL_18040 [Myxococcota bacterium]
MSNQTKQRYVPWTPVGGIPRRLHCEAIHDDVEGLRILLRGDNPSGSTLRLRFESVIGYRNVNESYRLQTWGELNMAQQPPLLIVENSSWIKWLHNEAGEVIDSEKVVHYAVFTSEDCIDILTEFPPTVEWLGSPE